jgi:hypothetical protein
MCERADRCVYLKGAHYTAYIPAIGEPPSAAVSFTQPFAEFRRKTTDKCRPGTGNSSVCRQALRVSKTHTLSRRRARRDDRGKNALRAAAQIECFSIPGSEWRIALRFAGIGTRPLLGSPPVLSTMVRRRFSIVAVAAVTPVHPSKHVFSGNHRVRARAADRSQSFLSQSKGKALTSAFPTAFVHSAHEHDKVEGVTPQASR